MAEIKYGDAAQKFLQGYQMSASRADRHARMAEEANYRRYQIERQGKLDERQSKLDKQNEDMTNLKLQQMEQQMKFAEAKNTKLEMDYTKKETIDYIGRFIDGGMVDNNLAKLALTGSDLKKQLFGDIVDVRDLNKTTDSDMITQIVNDLNSDEIEDERPWTAEDIIASNKYKILVDSQGKPKVKNIDELLAATGYKNYIDDKTWNRQMKENLVLSKVNKPATTSGTIQVVNQHMEDWKTLHPNPTKEEIAQERMNFLSGVTTKSFQAKEQNIKEEANVLIKELPFTKIKTGEELDLDSQVKLQKIEAGNNLSDTARQKISKDVTILNQLQKGITQLSEADAEDIGIGYKSIKTTIGRYLDLDKASDKEVHDAMLKIAGDSTIKGVLADYIKSISGAAASDTERDFLKQVMTGGDYTSKEGRLQALKNFQDNATKGTMSMLDIYYNKAPLTVYKAVQQLGKNSGVKQESLKKFDKYKVK